MLNTHLNFQIPIQKNCQTLSIFLSNLWKLNTTQKLLVQFVNGHFGPKGIKAKKTAWKLRAVGQERKRIGPRLSIYVIQLVEKLVFTLFHSLTYKNVCDKKLIMCLDIT